MSYCRFSEGDVYMFPSVWGFIECCACRLTPLLMNIMHESNTLETRSEALAHLHLHKANGHEVPQRAFDRLKEEIKTKGEELSVCLCDRCRERIVEITSPTGECLCGECFTKIHIKKEDKLCV